MPPPTRNGPHAHGGPFPLLNLFGNDPVTRSDPGGTVRLDMGDGATDPVTAFANAVTQLVSQVTQQGGVTGEGYRSGITFESTVKSPDLQSVLDGFYLRPGETSSIDGDDTLPTAVNHEMRTGIPVGGKWHINRAASTLTGLLRILNDSNANLTPEEQLLAMSLAQNLWRSITQKDIAGKVTDMLRVSQARAQDLQTTLRAALRTSMGRTLGNDSDYNWVDGRPEVKAPPPPPVTSPESGSRGGAGCGGFVAGPCDSYDGYGNGNGDDDPVPPEVVDPFVP